LKGQIREKKLLMETTKNKREEEEFKGLNVGLGGWLQRNTDVEPRGGRGV